MQLAKLIGDIAAGERPSDSPRPSPESPATEAPPQGRAQGRNGQGAEAVSEEAPCDCEEGGASALERAQNQRVKSAVAIRVTGATVIQIMSS